MTYNYRYLDTQNSVLNKNLMEFYTDTDNLSKIMQIVHGKSRISLRIIDWFVTNYAKKHFVVYDPRAVTRNPATGTATATATDGEECSSGYVRMDNGDMVYDSSGRFKVFNDYKMKLKAYSKKRFDPFCRWSRIQIPFDEETTMETTLGQLNFFKWAIEHRVLEYIDVHYDAIERDMNTRNSNSKRRRSPQSVESRSSDEDAMGIDDFAEQSIETNGFFQEDLDTTPETSDVVVVLDDLRRQGGLCEGDTVKEPSQPPSDPSTYSQGRSEEYVPEESSSNDARRKYDHSTTRKKREELSIYACKCIKKESVKILVKFT